MHEDAANNSGNRFSCLVVEDDPAFRSMVAQLIASLGGDVREAGNVADAQTEFERRRPDLILLDNHLPDGRGYEL
ncbi:MAG TPA: response regulator, partial [Verrucomicrobiae bacterium]|nr:response regulator [Verrucomicrobiae bacterium]